MITLKDFMETVDYRITEGSDYGWNCYGYDAYMLDSWNGEQDGHSLTIIFDTKTQTVYEVQAHDYVYNRAYRMINPDFKHEHDAENTRRGCDDQAWDDVAYVDLDVDDDFFQKCLAIREGEDYDTRVSVPVDFTDAEFMLYAKMAHERDITLNQLIEEALRAAIEDVRAGKLTKKQAKAWRKAQREKDLL
jgi:hypothetical protein